MIVTRQDIQEEYDVFLSGKLLFEMIFPDNLAFLMQKGHVFPTREDLHTAIRTANAYRQQVLRSFYFGKEKSNRDLIQPPVSQDGKDREREKSYRKMLAKKLLVFWWYEKNKQAGITKLFLELHATA